VSATPSQTVGPFFSIGLAHMNSASLCGQQAAGEHIYVAGTLLDGKRGPVPDALLELWQADSAGRFPGTDIVLGAMTESSFRGFGRVPTDGDGKFRFHTIRPGSVPTVDGRQQAPHIVVLLFMRGLLRHLTTRIYFADDERIATDPILALVGAKRTPTLLARPMEGSPGHYHWDVHLQGDQETVFFAL
jgi:protocatechuate 3,4-dioxygenase alpha subunit